MEYDCSKCGCAILGRRPIRLRNQDVCHECAYADPEYWRARAETSEAQFTDAIRSHQLERNSLCKDRDTWRARVAELEKRVSIAVALIDDTGRLLAEGKPVPPLDTLRAMYRDALCDGGG